jgi:hypothetical protein
MFNIWRRSYRTYIALACLLGLAAALSIDTRSAFSQTKESDTLTQQYMKLRNEGRYSAAIPLAERALSIQESLITTTRSSTA